MYKMMETILSPFPGILNASLTAGCIVIAILVVRLFFRNAPKWFYCALWGIVACRLVCPIAIESLFSLMPSSAPIPADLYTYEGASLQSPVVIEVLDNPLYHETVSYHPALSAETLQIKTLHFNLIWLAVTYAMLLYALISYLLLRKKLSDATLLSPGIKQSDKIPTPFVFGYFRPVIYAPYSISPADLSYVVSHEKMHIKYGDPWWKLLGFVILSLHWFNPLIWLAFLLFCRDLESACDERVISKMNEESRKAYSTALLNCSVQRRFAASSPLAFGEGNVKGRIKNIMNYRKHSIWIIAVAVLLCIILALCFLTNPKKQGEHEISMPEAAPGTIVSFFLTDDPETSAPDDNKTGEDTAVIRGIEQHADSTNCILELPDGSLQQLTIAPGASVITSSGNSLLDIQPGDTAAYQCQDGVLVSIVVLSSVHCGNQ